MKNYHRKFWGYVSNLVWMLNLFIASATKNNFMLALSILFLVGVYVLFAEDEFKK